MEAGGRGIGFFRESSLEMRVAYLGECGLATRPQMHGFEMSTLWIQHTAAKQAVAAFRTSAR